MTSPLKQIYNGVRSAMPDTPASNKLLGQVDFLRSHNRFASESPETLNEYIFSIKTNPEMVRYSDYVCKAKAKILMRNLLGDSLIIPTLLATAEANDLKGFYFDGPYIVKPTHSSGHTILKKEGGVLTEAEVAQCGGWLKENLFLITREYQYKNVTPQILIEPLITYQNELPPDFKFFFAGGECFMIQVDANRQHDHRRDLYSPDWGRQDFTLMHEHLETPMPKPENLPEMLEVAGKIAARFEFCRVDLYQSDAGIKFGEITFSPGNACDCFAPEQADQDLFQEVRTLIAHKRRASKRTQRRALQGTRVLAGFR